MSLRLSPRVHAARISNLLDLQEKATRVADLRCNIVYFEVVDSLAFSNK